MPIISATAARQTLPAQLDRVEKGEEIEITRHGRVVAILVSPQALRRRRAAHLWEEADRLAQDLEEARKRPLPSEALSAERAEELVRAIREDRDSR